MDAVINYLVRVMTWLSQGINTVLLGGSPDLTVSARCHVLQHRTGWGYARGVINALFFWQVDHCRESFQQDIQYAYWVNRKKL